MKNRSLDAKGICIASSASGPVFPHSDSLRRECGADRCAYATACAHYHTYDHAGANRCAYATAYVHYHTDGHAGADRCANAYATACAHYHTDDHTRADRWANYDAPA